MDSRRFDALTRSLSTNTSGTRRALGTLLGVIVSLLTLGPPAADEASARKRRKRGHHDRDGQRRKRVKTEGPCGNGSARKNRCRKNRHCCTNYCKKGKRKKGRKRTGRCRCRKLGQSCTEDRNCCPERTGRVCTAGSCQPAPTCIGPTDPCSPDLPCCEGLGCQDGQCLPPLCLETCLGGCCAGNDCQEGDTPEFCGVGGATCQTCETGLQCLDGICDCGTGTVCAVGCPYATLQDAIDDQDGPESIELCATTFAGPFTISRNVDIFGSGDGADGTVLDGQGAGSTVTVEGVSVTLHGLRITGGSGNGSNDGGGIVNNGGLSLELCTVTDNHVIDNGGGIHNGGSAVLGLFDCTVTDNTAGDDGGGILNDGLAQLFRSEVTDNEAGGDGGGINNLAGATLILDNSRVTDNTADEGEGGGIHNTGTVTFEGTSCLRNNDPDNCIGTGATCPICAP